MKAYIVHICINGFLMMLNVPSMYHLLAFFYSRACLLVKQTMCLRLAVTTSWRFSPSGISSSSNVKSSVFGFFGRVFALNKVWNFFNKYLGKKCVKIPNHVDWFTDLCSIHKFPSPIWCKVLGDDGVGNGLSRFPLIFQSFTLSVPVND